MEKLTKITYDEKSRTANFENEFSRSDIITHIQKHDVDILYQLNNPLTAIEANERFFVYVEGVLHGYEEGPVIAQVFKNQVTEQYFMVEPEREQHFREVTK